MNIFDKEQKTIKEFNSFCKTVLRNEKSDICRKNKRYNEHYISFSSLSFAPLETIGVHDEYLIDVLDMELRGMTVTIKDWLLIGVMEELSEQCKEILLMSYILEMSDTEIAKELKLSRGTVYYHKKKGIDKIKKYLEVTQHEQ